MIGGLVADQSTAEAYRSVKRDWRKSFPAGFGSPKTGAPNDRLANPNGRRPNPVRFDARSPSDPSSFRGAQPEMPRRATLPDSGQHVP